MKQRKMLFIILILLLVVVIGCGRRNSVRGDNSGLFQITDQIQNTQDSCTIAGHVTRQIFNEQIFMKLHSGTIAIKKNGVLIYEEKILSGSQQDFTFSSDWISFTAGDITTEDLIEITATGEAAAASVEQGAESFYVGDGLGLMRYMLWHNTAQIIIGILIGALGLTYAVVLFVFRGVRKEIPGGYVSCSVLLICGAVCTLVDYDYITLIFPNVQLINQIDYLSQVFICVSLLFYLKSFIQRENIGRVMNSLAWASLTSVVLYYLLHMTAAVTMKQYVRLQLPFVAASIVGAVILLIIDYRKHNQKKVKNLLQSGAVLGITAVAEMLHFYMTNIYWIWFFQLGLLAFSVLQFWILLQDAKERFILAQEAERKLAESQIAITLSQIQPHFLYNSLATIQNLCTRDPAAARTAIKDFAFFLRGNMDSLTSKVPIPFEREMKHVKNYLNLECMRFHELLNVEYDIEEDDFMLPALTIQPLVENAVNYGLGQKEDGGTIWIRTWRDEDHNYIEIKDDGEGFDVKSIQELPVQSDGRSHIGLSNVQKRLADMCQGTMQICSQKDVGTTITISLPR